MNNKIYKSLILITTFLYAIILIWGLWLKLNYNPDILMNYKFLKTMSLKERFFYDLIPFVIRFDFSNQFKIILLNCLVFSPFGVTFNLLFKKQNILRDILICFMFSLLIEILQLFSMIGSFATTDLITNTIGYFIGFLVYKVLFKKLNNKFINIFFIITTIISSLIVIFAIVQTINNLDIIIAILKREI